MSTRPEDWARVKDLFEAARGLAPDARHAFVADACGADAALRRELESLLASYDRAGGFLETPAARSVPGGLPSGLLAGRRLGPYELSSLIAAGGMGEVYAALDTRLGRQVAIKVLAGGLDADPQGPARFEREARAVAALSHPHICTLHDVGSLDGIHFLVMELLDGETLASRVVKGPMPLEEVLEYAIQIASALDRAHRAGIVHRDLKPGNIMLTRSGAKLLDFGLAKARGLVEPASTGLEPRDLTRPGVIMGTTQYMAPEQVDGREVDARTDLFSFGSVLYEMFTGRKAFDAPSSASLIAAILTSEPSPPTSVRPGLPPGVDYVVTRCLAKSPDDRWQTARDLLAELERIRGGEITGPGASRQRVVAFVRRAALWLAPVAAIAAMALGGMLLTRPAPRSEEARWLSILPPPGGFDLSPDPVVSPDGRAVVFKAQDRSHRVQVWLKRLDAPAAVPIPGTEGTDVTSAPFWSPDSESIGFFARGQLKRVDISGGAAQVLAAAPEPRGGTWSPGGVIIFNADTQNLMRVSATGGGLARIADASEGVRLFPHALPDGRHYLFTSGRFRDTGTGVYVASLDGPEIRKAIDVRSPAVYAAGYLLFVRQRALFAQRFDMARLEATGEPRHLADGVGLGYGNPFTYPFSASPGGVAAFWGGSWIPQTQLTWFDRAGRRLGTTGEPAAHSGFTLDRAQRRAALEVRDLASNSLDLWLLDPASRAGASRLTSTGAHSVPILSADGARLVVMERGRGIVSMPVGANGASTVIVPGPSSKWPSDVSADGRLVAYTDSMPEGWRLWSVAIDGRSEPRLHRQAPFALAAMMFSPDGQRVAYMSDESGRFEVYVDAYPEPQDRTRVSSGGGGLPRWRADGRELYFVAPDRTLMAVGVTTTASGVAFAPPRALFEGPGVNPDNSRVQYAPSPDGSRFLFNARVEDPTPVGITVITNWLALLER